MARFKTGRVSGSDFGGVDGTFWLIQQGHMCSPITLVLRSVQIRTDVHVRATAPTSRSDAGRTAALAMTALHQTPLYVQGIQ